MMEAETLTVHPERLNSRQAFRPPHKFTQFVLMLNIVGPFAWGSEQ